MTNPPRRSGARATFGPTAGDQKPIAPVAAEIRKFLTHTCTGCSPGQQCNPLMYCPIRNNLDGSPRAAAGQPPPSARPGPEPTRRQTTTPGLVIVRAHDGSYAVHQDGSGLELAGHLRRLRDALAIGNQLGRYEVYYTLPGQIIASQWNHAVVGGGAAIGRWLDSYQHVGERFPAEPIAPPAAEPPRPIAILCHFCDGSGRGEHGPYGNQCMRCWDAYPVLRRRGWCMAPTTFIPITRLDDWCELTARQRRAWDRWTSSARERRAWDRWTSSDAYRKAD